jgi:molybdopterin converting factor subunit 1
MARGSTRETCYALARDAVFSRESFAGPERVGRGGACRAVAVPRGSTLVKLVVLYFAALRDVLALREEPIELPAASAKVQDLAQYLSQRHPALAPHLGSVRFAVNESFVDLAAPLTSGDVVALIPPVTGG